jgi:stage II sporulation protein AB (anti-sigma F factor)
MFMYDNEMHLQFRSLSQNEAFARAAVAAFITQLNPTIAEITDIRTAVSEAVTNAIVHGYANEEGTVYLDCYICGANCMISVRDEGVGIEDISKARQPFFTTKPDLERSGMGFTVMETFMEVVDVKSTPGSGTEVTLQKRIGRPDAA